MGRRRPAGLGSPRRRTSVVIRGGQLGRAAHAGAADAAVAVRHLVQVLLVVVLGVVERRGLADLGRDGAVARGVQRLLVGLARRLEGGLLLGRRPVRRASGTACRCRCPGGSPGSGRGTPRTSRAASRRTPWPGRRPPAPPRCDRCGPSRSRRTSGAGCVPPGSRRPSSGRPRSARRSAPHPRSSPWRSRRPRGRRARGPRAGCRARRGWWAREGAVRAAGEGLVGADHLALGAAEEHVCYLQCPTTVHTTAVFRHPEPRSVAYLPRRPTPADSLAYMSEQQPGFETLRIHAGQEPDPTTGAVVPADLPGVDLQAGRRGRAARRLRVLPQRQPDAHGARGVPGRDRARPARAGVRQRPRRRGHAAADGVQAR
jgi:hypothetical protein